MRRIGKEREAIGALRKSRGNGQRPLHFYCLLHAMVYLGQVPVAQLDRAAAF